MKRDLTKILDLTADECIHLVERAAFMKRMRQDGREHEPLRRKSLAMIFEKASTRTRVSFELGMKELGGIALYLSATETQIGRGEPIGDTGKVLSRYVSAIMIRTYAQETVEELARASSVPVINGLSDLYHPCQMLADLFTVRELKGDFSALKIAYIGDANNVANSWIEAAALLGLNLVVAFPEAYRPAPVIEKLARKNANILFTHDPREAADNADVINTDVWVSMGMEKEKNERLKAFTGFGVDDALLAVAKKDVIVMHCLPAHRNEEISEPVFERFQDVIFTQAENRLHAQKALLEWLILEV
ncbi:MAG TPA: ornithine carbamoyltransferase [Syntrophorhabdales bacterium]|nr:ornithine carbamoyltransferase [Syntrophorhabdales bacterium]